MPGLFALTGTMALALLGALAIDWLGQRAGLTPPGFLVLPEANRNRFFGQVGNIDDISNAAE